MRQETPWRAGPCAGRRRWFPRRDARRPKGRAADLAAIPRRHPMPTRAFAPLALVPALLLALVAPLAATNVAWWNRGASTVRLAIGGGALEVTVVPDGGSALRLDGDGEHRWAFDGNTADLVGRAYTIRLRNRTPERLKVVVGVDGLNVYAKDAVVGSADGDTGSILEPWADRSLPGWQLDDQRAERFVFSPPEWSEGQGRAEAAIGL